jgi:hypothetical protein
MAVRSSERPTIAPSFDVEQYARDSDQRMVSAAPLSAVTPIAPVVPGAPPVPEIPVLLDIELTPIDDDGDGFTEIPPPSSETFDPGQANKPSEVRIATRPQWRAISDEALTNEMWARTLVGTPVVTMTGESLRRLPLDHRAGFVMSLMDGSMDLEMIVELCGMEREEALGLVRDLHASGVIVFR